MAKRRKIGAIEKAEQDLKPGFTLIEILSISFVIGAFIIIAFPLITRLIKESKYTTFATTINSFINGVSYKVNIQEYFLENEDTTYYIPTKCVPLERGGISSPFGDFKESYVVVTYNGEKYDYYYTGRDEQNNGLLLTHSNLLSGKSIEKNVKKIDLSIGVGERQYIIIFNDNCNKSDFKEIKSKRNIKEKQSAKYGFIEESVK